MMLYPLRFEPIFKQTLWGGNRLREVLHKNAPENTGESWEIAALEHEDSVVKEGPLAGRTLRQLCHTYGEQLLGKNVTARTGTDFPLLFKFIDAQKDLSLQVHPNDALARERHHCFGKTEMWYVVDAQPDAQLINGFVRELPRAHYAQAVQSGEILDYVGSYRVRAGDAFFIPAGRIHGIGAGILVAEIQQTSNITYRLYDYHRKDKNGKERELHTREGFDALDFSVLADAVVRPPVKDNTPSEIVCCPYFSVNLLAVQGDCPRDLRARGSFVAYMAVAGSAQLQCGGTIYPLTAGESLLVPACCAQYTLSGDARLLEVFI